LQHTAECPHCVAAKQIAKRVDPLLNGEQLDSVTTYLVETLIYVLRYETELRQYVLRELISRWHVPANPSS
jgi:glutaredoxin